MKIIIWVYLLTFASQLLRAQEVVFGNFEKNMAQTEKSIFNIKENAKSINYGYDIKYERIYIKASIDSLYLSGDITFYFISRSNSLDSILFDLSDNLIVDSIKYSNSFLSFIHTNDIINVYLSTSLTYGNQDSLRIYYHGYPDTIAGGSSISSSLHGPGNTPIIATLSEPFGAKYWMPCKQDLNDKIDSIDFYIQHPLGYRAASNGMLTKIDTVGSEVITHWKHRYPIDYYLIAFAITNYETFTFYYYNSYNNDSVPIVNYIYPENIADTTSILAINDILNLYDSLFIPYPFSMEKYGHAQFNWLGGMEHQTMSFVYNFNFELLAHEFAHQWFGDYITLSSWHDIWLNEGFATYLTGLCYEHLFNGYWWPIWKNLQINAITQQPDGSVFCDDTTSESRIFDSRLSYKKGAYVLHMLRWILGDSIFFQGVNNYLNDTLLAYNTVGTSYFKYHLETVGDTSLTEYFNDWYYGQGYPFYSISWTQLQDTVHFLLDQTPSDNSVSFFEMKVPLQLWRQGSDTMIILNNQMNHQTFNILLYGQVDSVIFDPDMQLIAKDTIIKTTNVDFQKKQSINIYPNPSSTKIYVNLPTNEIADIILVTNVNGENVFITNRKQSNYALDISTISNGNYFIKIVTNKGVYVEKLEIIH